MVTRAIEQSGNFVRALQDSGASVVMCPVISIEPLPVTMEPIRDVDRFDWVVFTSVNGVERFFSLLGEAGLKSPGRARLAAIGAETAARLAGFGCQAELVPSRFRAEELAEAFGGVGVRGSRVLLPRAAGARDVLPERLRAQGAEVKVLEIYRSVPPPNLTARLRQALRGGVDVITFTSSSTVRHFVDALQGDRLPATVQVACIGPITADTARERDIRVDIIASEYTARGLLEAIVRHHLSSATP
jgi:uroporphyrinogen III methyltransferase/synthase